MDLEERQGFAQEEFIVLDIRKIEEHTNEQYATIVFK
jgi:hypothetical protein